MSLTVVTGPMFAGKSTWIHAYVRRNATIGRRGLVLRPTMSARSTLDETAGRLSTHDHARSIECRDVDASVPLVQHVAKPAAEVHYVLVDEAQFCTGILDCVDRVVNDWGIDLVLVGLLTDFRNRPFVDASSGKPELCLALCEADHHIQLKALCTECRDGTTALFTRRKDCATRAHGDSAILVGSSESYEAVCRKHQTNGGRGPLVVH